jgi:VanZ family protein
MGIIFYASSLPANDVPPLFPFQDIVFHLGIYLMLAYFFARALQNTSTHIVAKKVMLFAIIFGVLYGITDEFHQSFVPGRDASILDLFVDSIGTFIGSLYYR